MFDLDQAIRGWARGLRRNASMDEPDLAEMESFLRDDVERRIAEGCDPERAFRAAVAAAAPAEDLGREYEASARLRRSPWHPERLMPALAWSWVKVAARKMRRHKGFTLINVAGLAAGLFACLLIFLWVRDDLGYDRFHAKAGRIYRVITETRSGGAVRRSAGVPAPLGPALKAEVPDVENYARVQSGWGWALHKGDGRFDGNEKLAGVDPSFFEIFDFPAVSGDPKAVLADPSGLLITDRLARKFFPDGDPVGKTLKLEIQDRAVGGVLKDIPRNSHFDFAFAIPLEKLAGFRHGNLDRWEWDQSATYLLLRAGADPRAVEGKMIAILRKNLPKAEGRVFLQPLKEIHLRSSAIDTWMVVYPNPGRIAYVYILSLTGACILLLAWLNFVSLSTARYRTRLREAATRRVFGAGRADLLRQFLGESALQVSLAFAVACAAAEAVLPAFGRLLQKDLRLWGSGSPAVYGGAAAIVALTVLLSAAGPALLLSSVRAERAAALLGRFEPAGKARWRTALVVIQFAATIVLVVLTQTVSGQLRFIQSKDKGFEPRNLISVRPPRGPGQEAPGAFAAWRAEILRCPDIVEASRAWLMVEPSDRPQPMRVEWEGRDPAAPVAFARLEGDEDLVSLLGLKVIAGRAFSREFGGDRDNWLLNESAAKAMGFRDPVGRELAVDGRRGTIVGVVRDFHLGSLHNPVLPRIIGLSDTGYVMAVRCRPGRTGPALAFLKTVQERLAPGSPFQYELIEDAIDRWYALERRAGTIFRASTGLAIVIACLGLLGLASFMAERRTKEIGIRKVLGSTVPEILRLLSRPFLSWLVLANVFAWPAGFLLARGWLDGFSYRISLGFGTFLLSSGAAAALTLTTVCVQCFRTARANPVESLRDE